MTLGFFSNSGKYLQCDNHMEFEKDCPEGLWFQFETQVSQISFVIQDHRQNLFVRQGLQLP